MDEHTSLRGSDPLPPEWAAKLEDVLGRYGYRLEDMSMGRVVMRIMTLVGKPTFRLVASLERIGYRPDVKDRSVLQYGDRAPIAFGWFKGKPRLDSERRVWAWREPDGWLEGGDAYHDDPKKAALHDWMRMRRDGLITRLVKH